MKKPPVKLIAKKIELDLRITFKSITLTSFEAKGSFARKLQCLYMIDDYDEYLLDCREHNVVPILLHRKHTKKFTTCKNWEEIYKFLIESENLLNE